MNRHALEKARAMELYRACVRHQWHELFPKIEKWEDLLDVERRKINEAALAEVRPHLNRSAKRAFGDRGYSTAGGTLATSIKTRGR